jgi:ribosome-associated translation inhibitor RaiA
MKIDVQARGFSLTDALRNAVHRETDRLVQGLRRPIIRISVRLFDVNGLRGGPDKGCLVHVHFADGISIVGSDVESDLYNSVSAAFDKVLRSAHARLARRRTLRRSAARPLLAGA